MIRPGLGNPLVPGFRQDSKCTNVCVWHIVFAGGGAGGWFTFFKLLNGLLHFCCSNREGSLKGPWRMKQGGCTKSPFPMAEESGLAVSPIGTCCVSSFHRSKGKAGKLLQDALSASRQHYSFIS